MTIEQQINEAMQIIVPTAGYALYNFTFLVILISQLYGINMKKAKMNVGLIYVLSFMVQLVSIMFLLIQPKLETDMTLTYLFLGMVGGSLRDEANNNPIKYYLLQLKDAVKCMKRDLVVAPIQLAKQKVVKFNASFYPAPEATKENEF
jgi:hypothetical protein